MTIKQLKEIIKDIPDDTKILVYDERGDGCWREGCSCTDLEGYRDEITDEYIEGRFLGFSF